MVNNNYSFLTVIAVALVVAVVVSLITASITGNVIKVQEKKKGTEVYTKEEVDNKLNPFFLDIQKFKDETNTRLDSLYRFTVRVISSVDKNNIYGNMNCEEVCGVLKIDRNGKDVNGQNCLFVALSDTEMNSFGGNVTDAKVFDHNSCYRKTKTYFEGGYSSVSCFCG